jgi:methyl-accepting chemotaxis protein
MIRVFNNLRLRNKFLLIFAVFAIPVVILLTVLFFMIQSGFYSDSTQLANQISNEIERSLTTQFEEYQNNSSIISSEIVVTDSLSVLATSTSSAEEKEVATAALDNAILENLSIYGYTDSFIIDSNGIARYSATDDNLVGANLSEREYFQTALSGEATWSNFFYSEIADTNVMLYAVPINNNTGDTTGVYCIMIEQKVIDTLVEEAVVAAGIQDYTDAYLISQQGVFLTNEISANIGDAQEGEEGTESSIVPLETVNETEAATILIPEIEADNTEFFEIAEYNNYNGTDVMGALSVIHPSSSPIGLALEFDIAVVNEIVNGVLLVLIIVILLILIMVTVVTLFLNYLSRALGRVINNIELVANYDLSIKLPKNVLERKDEFGNLYQAQVTQVDNLKELVTGIQESAEQLSSSSQELDAIAQQSSMASDDVSKTIDDIAGSASEQAQNTTESASKLNDFGKMVDSEVQELEELSNTTTIIDHLADEGLNILNKLDQTSQTQYDMTQTVYESIIKTNDSSLKIQEASDLITDIANETTLLALNAAIEAANAGEYGKGFAVVAEEIRKLAEQSGDSTKQIDSIVKELIGVSNDAVDAITTTNEIVVEQKNDMKETKEKYIEIMRNIENVENKIEDINQSTNYMAKENVNIQDLIQSLAAIAEENAASTEEASAAAEEQTASMEEISNATDDLSKLSQNLQELTQKFVF